MENLLTDLSSILPLLPALVISLTANLKCSKHPQINFLIPYIIAICLMIMLYFMFGENRLIVYIFNGLILGYSATIAYDTARKQK